MAENKTKKTALSVDDFLGTLDDGRRTECEQVVKLMSSVTKQEPKMWGTSIVGFGDYHYKYASGREGDWFLCGFSPRKAALTLYVMSGFEQYNDVMSKLGKYTTGSSCLYVKNLSDIDLKVLKTLLTQSVKHVKKTYGG
jgi:hypothetical protein